MTLAEGKPKSTLQKPEAVEFAFYTTFIDKKNYLPQKAIYTNKTGAAYREIEVLESKDIQGFSTVTKMIARDL